MSEINSWPQIHIGKYTLYVASSTQQQKQGLQLVHKLPANHLVLFQPMLPDCYFHTVNCLFSLDIIPLNLENEVLDIWTVGTNLKLVGPTPPRTASVIEGPSGWAKKLELKVGSNLMEALRA